MVINVDQSILHFEKKLNIKASVKHPTQTEIADTGKIYLGYIGEFRWLHHYFIASLVHCTKSLVYIENKSKCNG